MATPEQCDTLLKALSALLNALKFLLKELSESGASDAIIDDIQKLAISIKNLSKFIEEHCQPVPVPPPA